MTGQYQSSRDAILQDRIAENRELRMEAARALELIEQGEVEQAKSLLRRVSRNVSTSTTEK